MSVYLKDDVDAGASGRRSRPCWRRATSSPSREYVSKADALARFKQTFGELAATIDGAGDNPLPASFEVRLQPGPGASAAVDALGSAACGRCRASPTFATTASG